MGSCVDRGRAVFVLVFVFVFVKTRGSSPSPILGEGRGEGFLAAAPSERGLRRLLQGPAAAPVANARHAEYTRRSHRRATASRRRQVPAVRMRFTAGEELHGERVREREQENHRGQLLRGLHGRARLPARRAAHGLRRRPGLVHRPDRRSSALALLGRVRAFARVSARDGRTTSSCSTWSSGARCKTSR